MQKAKLVIFNTYCNKIRKLLNIVDRNCNKLECYPVSLSNLELKHPDSVSVALPEPEQNRQTHEAGHTLLLMHKRWGRNTITVLTSFFSHFANHNKEAQWKCNTNPYICLVKPWDGLWCFAKVKKNGVTQNQCESDLCSHLPAFILPDLLSKDRR